MARVTLAAETFRTLPSKMLGLEPASLAALALDLRAERLLRDARAPRDEPDEPDTGEAWGPSDRRTLEVITGG